MTMETAANQENLAQGNLGHTVGTGARDKALCVGVLGGGQLARMMQPPAVALGIELHAAVENRDGSAAQVICDSAVMELQDTDKLRKLLADVAVVTCEHEHIPDSVYMACEEAGKPFYPPAEALHFARNKLALRELAQSLGLPNPQWIKAENLAQIQEFGAKVGWPIIVKTPTGGYDGKGVRVVDEKLASAPDAELQNWLASGPLLLEEKVEFGGEVAQLLARRPSGEIACWDLTETVQAGGVCSVCVAPARVSAQLANRAKEIALEIARATGVVGVLAVEMFVRRIPDENGEYLVVNELAMRPHNSGHWTIDGSVTSQFEQHLRAVLDLPLGSTRMVEPVSVMVNLLGSTLSDPRQAYEKVLAQMPAAKVHIYGKEVRPRRKIGHVTVTGSEVADAYAQAKGAVDLLFGADAGVPALPEPLETQHSAAPAVGIVMGSDSDWSVMEAAAKALEELGVSYEVGVVSAHRMPFDMLKYGSEAAGRGVRLLIAGAGGAAHLPGMLAAVTPLPVIGVPVPLKHLDGMDSLLSIVQMPAGVPVATVGVGAARNAGLLAARIIASGTTREDGQVRAQMGQFQADLRQVALDKGAALNSHVAAPAAYRPES